MGGSTYSTAAGMGGIGLLACCLGMRSADFAFLSEVACHRLLDCIVFLFPISHAGRMEIFALIHIGQRQLGFHTCYLPFRVELT